MYDFMQTVAYDAQGELIAAYHAKRGEDYACAQCQSPVRKRSGLFQKAHFYHLSQGDTLCHRRDRSSVHREIQDFMQQEFHGELALEVRFPTIDRIADMVWQKENVIFELQCTPLAPHKALQRVHDYAQVGYQVIWLLLEERFYGTRVSALERTLQGQPYAFISQRGLCFLDRSPHMHGKRLAPPRLCPITWQPFDRQLLLQPNPSRAHFIPSWWRALYYRCLIGC